MTKSFLKKLDPLRYRRLSQMEVPRSIRETTRFYDGYQSFKISCIHTIIYIFSYWNINISYVVNSCNYLNIMNFDYF